MRSQYPIVDLTTHGAEVVPHRAVDLETLSAELAPIRDALLELFENDPAVRRVALQRLEVTLSITRDGHIAFPTGNAAASLTLTFERRLPSASRRVTKAKTAEGSEAKPAQATEPKVLTLD
jgi:hypothetical protein